MLTQEEIKAAKEWLKDCQWRDVDNDDIDELSDEQAERAIKKYYHSGIEGFIEEGLYLEAIITVFPLELKATNNNGKK
jgi:hypothetical protein